MTVLMTHRPTLNPVALAISNEIVKIKDGRFVVVVVVLIGRALLVSHNAEATNGPIAQPYECLCVCVMCSSRKPCTVFSNAPSLILASFLCAKSRGCPCPGMPDRAGTPIRRAGPAAGQPPSTQHTARVAWNISIN